MVLKKKLFTSAAITLLIAILTWLVLGGQQSPFHNYFLYNVGLPNFLRLLNIGPFVLAAVIEGNNHGGTTAVIIFCFFLWWFIISYIFLSLAIFLRNPSVRK